VEPHRHRIRNGQLRVLIVLWAVRRALRSGAVSAGERFVAGRIVRKLRGVGLQCRLQGLRHPVEERELGLSMRSAVLYACSGVIEQVARYFGVLSIHRNSWCLGQVSTARHGGAREGKQAAHHLGPRFAHIELLAELAQVFGNGGGREFTAGQALIARLGTQIQPGFIELVCYLGIDPDGAAIAGQGTDAADSPRGGAVWGGLAGEDHLINGEPETLGKALPELLHSKRTFERVAGHAGPHDV